ncbi:MAG: type IX secretion system membrane protein PorP/SprF [Bacteroidales bacterium]|jgi:hypothetical protein|nr:type IX secretion system membrane protein PorP/SprF [Bacteroidales bacterium]
MKHLLLILITILLCRANAQPFTATVTDEETDYRCSLMNKTTDKFAFSVSTIQQWLSIEKNPNTYILNAEYRPVKQFGINTHISSLNMGFSRDLSWFVKPTTTLQVAENIFLQTNIAYGGMYRHFSMNYDEVITEHPAYPNVVRDYGYFHYAGAGFGVEFSDGKHYFLCSTQGFLMLNNRNISTSAIKEYQINTLLKYRLIMPSAALTFSFRHKYDFYIKNNNLFISATLEKKWFDFSVGSYYGIKTRLFSPVAGVDFTLKNIGLAIGYKVIVPLSVVRGSTTCAGLVNYFTVSYLLMPKAATVKKAEVEDSETD